MLLLVLMLALLRPAPIDFLGLATAPLGAGTPPAWKVRAVRGQAPPDAEVLDGDGGRVLRISGRGRAAWFYRELPAELHEQRGTLRWAWRVVEAPRSANLRTDSLDDSPMRVYVVFGRPGLFGRSARIIFYSFGNLEPSGFDRASRASDRMHVVRVDGAAERSRWLDHQVDPFADYRRFWNGAPPPITAVGVMQDTDQTKDQASAELRRLEWVSEP